MRYFESNLAKAVNQIRNRTGTVFHRRYSAEQILDDNALVDRVLYIVMNPVRAGDVAPISTEHLARGIRNGKSTGCQPVRAGRRRRFTAQQNLRLLEEAALPGNSISETARTYGIYPSQMFQWRWPQP